MSRRAKNSIFRRLRRARVHYRAGSVRWGCDLEGVPFITTHIGIFYFQSLRTLRCGIKKSSPTYILHKNIIGIDW